MLEDHRIYNNELCKTLRNKFIEGDDSAYAELYNIFSKDLYAYGMFLCNDKKITEDALQDVFTILFANRKLLANIDNIKYYFNCSFRNRIYYLLKKEAKNVNIDEISFDTIPDCQNIQDEYIKKEESIQKEYTVKKIFNSLNSNQKEVLYKRFIDEMSLDEIADLMQINYQSVKNLIQRALKKIKNSETIIHISITIIPVKIISLLIL